MSANALFRPTFADLRDEIERRAAQESPAEEIAALTAVIEANPPQQPPKRSRYLGDTFPALKFLQVLQRDSRRMFKQVSDRGQRLAGWIFD